MNFYRVKKVSVYTTYILYSCDKKLSVLVLLVISESFINLVSEDFEEQLDIDIDIIDKLTKKHCASECTYGADGETRTPIPLGASS